MKDASEGKYLRGQRVRINLVYSAFLLGAAVLAAHLFFLQNNPEICRYYRELQQAQWESSEEPTGRRGNVYFRDGVSLLAGNRKAAMILVEKGVALGCDPTICDEAKLTTEQLAKLEALSSNLSEYLQLPPTEVRRTIMQLRRGKELARGLSLETARQLDKLRLPGVYTRYHYERHYPHGEFGAPAVVGYAGREPGLRGGLEYTCDDLLSGSNGLVKYCKDAQRRKLPASIELARPRIDGEDLHTTLHPEIQFICEEELREAIASNRSEWGCILVLEPNTGEVLGAATLPAYDPNQYAQGQIGDELNLITQGLVEPGSTAKPILAAFALSEGWVDPGKSYNCGAALKIGENSIREAEASHFLTGPDVTLGDIISKSSNVGMARIALELGEARVLASYRGMGLFQQTGIELPLESRGKRPAALAKGNTDSPQWPRITLATTGFGQGFTATPLQIAAAYSIIANGGYAVKPTLLLEDRPGVEKETAQPANGNELPAGETLLTELLPAAGIGVASAAQSAVTKDSRRRVLTSEACSQMQQWLVDVVNLGTGKQAKLERYQAAGKTGTGQLPAPGGGYAKGEYLSSFVGYFPVERAQFLVLVMFCKPKGGVYYGGAVAAPVFKRVGDRISYVTAVLPPGTPDAPR